MTEPARTGGCFCGDVRYTVRGEPRHLCFCHCASCRRATGVPAVPWATFVAAQFTVTRGQIAHYASSPGVARGFCSRCGTALTYTHAQRPGEIDITLATLDEPETWAPEVHIWVRDKLSWVRIGDDLPQWPATSQG